MKLRHNLIALGAALALCLTNATGGTLNFADMPLSLKSAVPPNVLFSLSVEFPTAISKAYGGSYSPTNEYLGYYDSSKCYTYIANPGDDPATTNKGWFERSGSTTDRTCSGAWSGNFLNWASMTALDEFRHAMTGGARYIDTSTLTVLERAYNDAWSGQSYFPDKTYQGAGAHPFPAGKTLTIVNATKGHKMTVSFGGTDTVTCSTPTNTGSFSCTLAINGYSGAGTCNTWTGDGSLSNPFKCTSMSFGTLGTFTTAANTLTTSGNASAVSGGTSTETITCTSPQPTNAEVTTGNFSCTLKDSGNNTRQCTTWSGLGTIASPFTCTAWQAYNGEIFAASSTGTALPFTSTYTGTTSGSANNQSCTVARCGTNNSPVCWSCANVNGHTFSCQRNRPNNNNSAPYSCNGTWTSNGSETNISGSAASSAPSTALDSRDYFNKFNFTWDTSGSLTKSYYYTPSYAGNDTASYYYYPSYTVTYGGTAEDYFVRVKVCEPGHLEANCQLQANGTTYKPVGVLQEKADIMRFGVFSYFNSPSNDNAVMRARLKHVGPNKYATGGSVANDYKEWNTDGTLIKNPDSAEATASKNAKTGGVDNSGVINYINKFGTTGSGSYRYKQYDPLSKLYYETMRYVRNLTPTAGFSNDVTSSNDDNFPVITDWYNSSRELERYSCQKNYIIAMGDKNTHCDKRLPGGTLTNSSGQCNASANSTTQLADAGSIDNGDPFNATTETNYVGTREGLGSIGGQKTGSGSAGSYYISGLAAWAARNNIRPDKTGVDWVAAKPRVKTFILNVEEGGNCSFESQFWLAAKYGDPKSYDDANNPTVAGTWRNPATDGVLDDTNQIWRKSVDIMANSCTGGLPTGFVATAQNTGVPWPAGLLRGGDPASMINSVKAALDEVATEVGVESALAQSSGDLRTSQIGAYIYRATFNSSNWSGDVQAYFVSPDGTLATDATWKASTKLPTWGSRKIFTFNDGLKTDGTAETSDSSARRGVEFSGSNFGNLSERQQDLLNHDEAGVADSLGNDRISYLRGDQSKEGSATGAHGWRKRTSLLGDIVNSNPNYVGPPTVGLKGKDVAATSYYQAFAQSVVSRTPMVYVGSNDGMLHGYDTSVDSTGAASTVAGTERIAYVPSALYATLPKLVSANYTHKYFVDGSPTTGEACFGDCSSASKWKSILVGGLNAGGQGLYALNITDPDSFFSTTNPAGATDVVLWEFTDRDDKHLGNTYGQPEIRLMNNDKWAVISGNGYNNTVADGSQSDTGRAYIYILYVDGPGNGNPWVKDTHYIRIELKSPTEATATLPNGIAYIAPVDKNLDGKVDYLYAGDLNGNLWKIDVSNTDPTKWKSAFVNSGGDPLPLFTATDGATTPNAQTITGGLEVSRHPSGGYLVMFGTGIFIRTGDNATTTQDSYYGIWDKDDGTRVTNRSSLQKQQVAGSASVDGTSYFFMTQCKPNYTTAVVASNQEDASATSNGCPSAIAYTNSGQQLGWVIDLPNSGERYVNAKPKIDSGILTFSTLQPSANPCTGNTSGREYDLDYLSGGASSNPVFDMNGDGSITSADYVSVTIGGQTFSRPASGKQYSGGSSDTPVRVQVGGGAGSGSGTGTYTSCTDFIPGWGCPSLMRRPTTNCSKWVEDIVSAEILTNLTGSGLKGTKKCLNAPSGRLNWRQIIR